MPAVFDLHRLGAIAAAYMVGALLLVNAAIGFVVVGAVLGIAAFVLWLQNRANLTQLNEFLAHQARTGMAAVDKLSGDGA